MKKSELKRTPFRVKPKTAEQQREEFERNLSRKQLAKVGKRAKQAKSKLAKTGYRKADACEMCGSTYGLEAHHILHRSTHPCLVAEPENLITTCSHCHAYAHLMQDEFDYEVETKWPGRLDELRQMSRQNSKSNIGRIL